MSKITSVLWLGNQKNALSEAFLKKHHITHILCCANHYFLFDEIS